jgi:hypothetical protein
MNSLDRTLEFPQGISSRLAEYKSSVEYNDLKSKSKAGVFSVTASIYVLSNSLKVITKGNFNLRFLVRHSPHTVISLKWV